MHTRSARTTPSGQSDRRQKARSERALATSDGAADLHQRGRRRTHPHPLDLDHRHIGYVVSGVLHVEHEDGTTDELTPGSVYRVAPGTTLGPSAPRPPSSSSSRAPRTTPRANGRAEVPGSRPKSLQSPLVDRTYDRSLSAPGVPGHHEDGVSTTRAGFVGANRAVVAPATVIAKRLARLRPAAPPLRRAPERDAPGSWRAACRSGA